ncbi:nucleotide-binding universal stress UspA family protein [Streptomyces sp. 3330]|uniref:universal stress protein n=1 Tax=Streptomyces sp. 3330 TaxID=2817755 RepID=UPI002855A614|nr:universal stress protein [Streptomyces sp. 3330]MDR6975930.1 nucleotide-binding universal stress UspA family protein [Streptomyces sp. 3330]
MTSHRTVVGVDGSLISARALDWAAAEAVRRGGTLRVLYAVPDRDEAAPVLGYAAARVRARYPRLPVETVPAEGGTVRALARESADADLTVVGTRGLGAWAGPALGSVSLRLAALARGPLLVVRGDHPCDDGRDVLLGLAGDADDGAAAYALGEAERRGARLRVVHSPSRRHRTPELPSPVPAAGPRQERPARAAAAEEAVPRFALARPADRHPGVTAEARTVRAAPADELVAGTREAAVVVIGARRRRGRLGPRLDPVVRALLHRAHCPVVVVPHG